MEDATSDYAAFAEAVVFLSYFKELKDPRQQGKVTYPLDEILLLCLLAVLAGAETFVDIALHRERIAAGGNRQRAERATPHDGLCVHALARAIDAALRENRDRRRYAHLIIPGGPDIKAPR